MLCYPDASGFSCPAAASYRQIFLNERWAVIKLFLWIKLNLVSCSLMPPTPALSDYSPSGVKTWCLHFTVMPMLLHTDVLSESTYGDSRIRGTL